MAAGRNGSRKIEKSPKTYPSQPSAAFKVKGTNEAIRTYLDDVQKDAWTTETKCSSTSEAQPNSQER